MGALCMAFHKLAQRQLPVARRRRRDPAAAGAAPRGEAVRRAAVRVPPARRAQRGRGARGARDAGDAQGRRVRRRRRRADPRRGRGLRVLHPGVRPRDLGGGGQLADHGGRRTRGAARRAGDPRRGVLRQPRRGGDERGAPLHGRDGRPRRRLAVDRRDHGPGRLQEARVVGQGAPGADPQGADLRPGARARRLHCPPLRRVHAAAVPAREPAARTTEDEG